jgi:hypothetical protein
VVESKTAFLSETLLAIQEINAIIRCFFSKDKHTRSCKQTELLTDRRYLRLQPTEVSSAGAQPLGKNGNYPTCHCNMFVHQFIKGRLI